MSYVLCKHENKIDLINHATKNMHYQRTLELESSGADEVVAVLSDVANPRKRLVATLLDNLQVAHLRVEKMQKVKSGLLLIPIVLARMKIATEQNRVSD